MLIISLLFNGLLIFSDAVQTAVAAAATAVGLRTVAARQADNIARNSAMLAAERDASRKMRTTLDDTRREREAARRQANDAARAKTELVETRKEMDAARKRTKDTAERVNRRFRLAAAREVAVMPAEAMPGIGAAVIVAATAAEIHDMCETMKDMSDLTRALDFESTPAAEAPTVCSVEVPDRRELLERSRSAPDQAWNKAREVLGDLGSIEVGGDLAPKFLDIPQDALEWSTGTWEDQMSNFRLWWHGSE